MSMTIVFVFVRVWENPVLPVINDLLPVSQFSDNVRALTDVELSLLLKIKASFKGWREMKLNVSVCDINQYFWPFYRRVENVASSAIFSPEPLTDPCSDDPVCVAARKRDFYFLREVPAAEGCACVRCADTAAC